MAAKNSYLFFYTGLFSILLPIVSFAQSTIQLPSIAKDQYIIEIPKNLSSQENLDLAEDLNKQGLAISAELNKDENIFLVEDTTSATARQIGIPISDQIVPFTESEVICEQLYKKHLVTTCSADVIQEATLVPSDSNYNEQWGHKAGRGINSEPAWDISQGDGSVVVAVIDTGVDYNHDDLKDNIWTNPNEIAGDGIDNDGNGYIDDIHGINVINNTGDPFDDNSHGTHCSGIIGAKGNNYLGVAGVNWNVKIMGLKFLNKFGGGLTSDAVKAIDYMINMKTDHGINVKISSNSWGSTGYTKALQDAVGRANTAGIIFVAAAGNSETNIDYKSFYPATYDFPNVVSVAASSEYTANASDPIPDVAYFSNYGVNTVDIAAPGESIVSTTPGNNYQSFSGTSMAAPFVSGALSLLASIEPTLSANQLIERLLNTASANPYFENVSTNGRVLNLANLISNTAVPTPTPLPGCNYTVEEIPFAPDTNLGTFSNKTLSQGYFNTAAANLSFSFPFYGTSNSKVNISQSGFIYLGEEMPTADLYDNIGKNLSFPPVNTISVFKSFCYVANPTTDGIFTKDEGNAFKVYWAVFDINNTAAGKFQSWLTLHDDGLIEEFISFPNERLRQTINSHSLNGIRALNTADSITYSQNGFPSTLKMNLGLRFTPVGSACTTIAPTTTTTSTTTSSTTSTTTTTTTTSTTLAPQTLEESVSSITLNVSRVKSKKVSLSGTLVISNNNFNFSNFVVNIKCQYSKKKNYNFKARTDTSGKYNLTIKKSKLKKSTCTSTSSVYQKKLVSSIFEYRGK